MTTIDLASCLAAIPDRRRAEGKIYGQVGVILFSIIAMLSGARSYRQIHTLIRARLALLNAAFPEAALRRAPAYTSVRGILQRLDPDELEQAFRRHAEGLDRPAPTRHRGSSRSTERRCGRASTPSRTARRRMFSAPSPSITRSFSPMRSIDEKSNEIPAVQTLIAALGLSGRVFTLDAMHCQKNLRDRPRDRQ